MQTLNIMGAGRVGQTLGHLWQQSRSFVLQDVLTRHADTAEAACAFMRGGTPVGEMAGMRPADVWMLAVPDAQIRAAAEQLAHACGPQTTAPLVFHCSGAQSSDSLEALAAMGWRTASAHCILSFASAGVAVQQFAGTACALEGPADATATLHTAFTAIQAHCFTVQREHKLLYHAAAVFATNFLPVIQQTAEDAWRATGVPEALLPHLRESLLQNAVANITRMGPSKALTGPGARGDVEAIAKQAEVVTAWDAKAGAAYVALSDLALRMAKASKVTSTDTASPH